MSSEYRHKHCIHFFVIMPHIRCDSPAWGCYVFPRSRLQLTVYLWSRVAVTCRGCPWCWSRPPRVTRTTKHWESHDLWTSTGQLGEVGRICQDLDFQNCVFILIHLFVSINCFIQSFILNLSNSRNKWSTKKKGAVLSYLLPIWSNCEPHKRPNNWCLTVLWAFNDLRDACKTQIYIPIS